MEGDGMEKELMERKISTTRWRFLTEESLNWVESGFISTGQRDAILGGYSVAKQWPLIVLSLGASMIGLGVLSFIAANWRILADSLKVALVIGSYLASVGAAYFYETKGRKPVSDVSMLFSGFVLLGGLALISQVFHIEGSATDLLLTWLLVYAPTFLLVRSLHVYALYEIVALVYMNMAYSLSLSRWWRYGPFTFATTLVTPYQPLLLMIVLVAVAWSIWKDERRLPKIDSASHLKNFFVGGSTRRIVLSNFFILNWFTWICIINSSGEPIAYYMFGVLILGALIGVTAWKLDAGDLDWQGLLLVWAAGMALSFPWVWHRYRYFHYLDDGSLVGPLTTSVLLGAYLVLRVIRHQRGGTAIFLFYLLLGRWYADMFYSFMSKSLFFIVGGVLLLMVAFTYRWNSRRRGGGKKEGENHDHSTDPAV
jgi:uncharacterized membrane protein